MKQTSKPYRRGAGRVAFLARIGAIREKLLAGHTLASVYDDHQKELGVSYSQFTRYVDKFIRNDKRDEQRLSEIRNESQDATITKKSNEGAPKEKPAGKSNRLRGFDYNPDRKKKDNLI
jgi:hypothetical protein